MSFTKDQLDAAEKHLLRDGRWGNACVSVASVDGKRWTIKDFSSRNWLVRNTFGRFVLNREMKMIQKLKGIKNVPQEAFLVTPDILAIEFLPGKPLSRCENSITPEYLEKAEELVKELHARDIVHLDTRGTGNWLVTPEGEPALIDFQAGFCIKWFPKKIASFMRDMDMGGVLKKWMELFPDKAGDQRRGEAERINKLRKLWKIRGYLGSKGAHKHGSFND